MPARSEIDSAPGASGGDDISRLGDTVSRLLFWTGTDCGPEAADRAAERSLRDFPGEAAAVRTGRLVAATAGCGLKASPVRLTVAEAAWHAHPDSPLAVLWREAGGASRWLVVVRRGWAKVKLDGLTEPGDVRWMSVSELERLLAAGPDDRIDWVLVEPSLPAAEFSAASVDRDGEDVHAADGHGHPSPSERLKVLARLENRDLWTLLWYAIVTGLLYLAIPLAVDAMVSNIAFGGQQRVYVQGLVILGAVLATVLILHAVVRAMAFVVIERLQRRLFVRFTADFATRLPRVKQSEFERVHGPELTNRFFDIMTLQKAAAQLLLDGLDVALSFLAGAVVLAFYDWTLFWFDAGLLVLVWLVIWQSGRNGVRTSIEESRVKYATAGWLQQVAMFSSVFKAPGGAELAARRTDGYAREYLTQRRNHFRILFRQVVGLYAIEVLAGVALLLCGGMLVLAGHLSVGQLVASQLILTATLAAVSKFGKQLETAYDLLTAIDKIGHLVDLPMERETGAEPRPGSPAGSGVAVSRVGFSYAQGKPVFSGLSIGLEPGDRVALVAEASTGSSTLLDLLVGLRQPSSGHIEIDGLDLRDWKPATLREHVARVRGDDEIFDGSVFDNVRLGNDAIGEAEVREALDAAGLLEKVRAMRAGIREPLALLGRSLSGTERRQIVLARAVAQRPRLLLLDGTLDGFEAVEIDRILKHLFAPERPWTLVVVTRDPDVMRHFKKTITLPARSGRDGAASPG